MLPTSLETQQQRLACRQLMSLSFLDLPAEIRLNVYSYLIPASEHGSIQVAICSKSLQHHHNQRQQQRNKGWRPTVVQQYDHFNASPILQQTLRIEALTRSYGLHLLRLPSREIHAEVLECLSRASTSFHCPECFDIFLQHFSFGFFCPPEAGTSIMSWLRHVEILVDVDRCTSSPECKRFAQPTTTTAAAVWTESYYRWRGTPGYRRRATAMTNEMARTITREELKFALRTAALYTGMIHDGMARGWKWTYQPAETKIAGQQQQQQAVEDGGGGGGGVDEDDVAGLGWYQRMHATYIRHWVIKGSAPPTTTTTTTALTGEAERAQQTNRSARAYSYTWDIRGIAACDWRQSQTTTTTTPPLQCGSRPFDPPPSRKVNLMKSRFSPN